MKKHSNKLGKGLDAIFMENSVFDDSTPSDLLEISLLEPNKAQPRKEFDQAALESLADSISQHGVLQPLLVRPLTNGNYQIIAGERRWRACRMAGITEVPVIIKDLTDVEVLQIALIENIQRENLSPIEEAKAYRALMDDCSLTQEQVSKSVGKSRPYITNTIRLLNLPDSVLDMISKKELSQGHARTLLSLQDKSKIESVAKMCAEKGISVRELEKLVKSINDQNNDIDNQKLQSDNSKNTNDVFFKEVEILLRERLGRKVCVNKNANKKGGTLQIHFFNDEDLTEIAKIIGNLRG